MSSSSRNTLASDVEITGTIKFSHDLIIDGKIDGEVTSDGNLTIGENAEIKGEIKTKSVVVFGRVNGNIEVKDHCDVKKDAQIVGDIKAGTLSIEGGASFVGQSAVGQSASSQAPSAGKPGGSK
jgi:cytoskeletal protein CcmA (bactofilin family)